MVKSIMEILLQLGCVIPLLLIFMNSRDKKTVQLLLLFCGYFLLNQILLILPMQVETFKLFEGGWNWSGKLYSIIGSILFYFVFRKQFPENDFLTLKQAPGSFKKNALITGILGTLALLAGLFMFSKSAFNFEQLAFQFSMPGLEEELAYRGIMMGILLTFLKDKISIGKLSIGHPAIWVTALLFSLIHVLHIKSISPSIEITMNWPFFWQSLIMGYLLGWMALKSRSIVMPIMAHNAANFFRNLGTMLK